MRSCDLRAAMNEIRHKARAIRQQRLSGALSVSQHPTIDEPTDEDHIRMLVAVRPLYTRVRLTHREWAKKELQKWKRSMLHFRQHRMSDQAWNELIGKAIGDENRNQKME